jgi:hypothetical protein
MKNSLIVLLSSLLPLVASASSVNLRNGEQSQLGHTQITCGGHEDQHEDRRESREYGYMSSEINQLLLVSFSNYSNVGIVGPNSKIKLLSRGTFTAGGSRGVRVIVIENTYTGLASARNGTIGTFVESDTSFQF